MKKIYKISNSIIIAIMGIFGLSSCQTIKVMAKEIIEEQQKTEQIQQEQKPQPQPPATPKYGMPISKYGMPPSVWNRKVNQ
ncbi:MAG: hypothetical protein LBN95_12925 [Prevotellaceae bacterium]|jgi:hypothetical protein|nr:hypothetical protein [Prevotellaceae bacterium]